MCKFIDEFEAATDSDAMISCAIQLLSKIAASSETKSVSNRYNMLIKVKLPRKLGDDTKPRNRRQYIRNKGKEISNILCTAIPDINVRKDVLSYILKGQFNVDICFDKVKKKQLLVVDCITIRMKGGHGMSKRSFERMMKTLVLIMKDDSILRVSDPIPLGLRKKIGNLKGKGTV